MALSVARIAEPVLRDLGFRLVRVKLSGQAGEPDQDDLDAGDPDAAANLPPVKGPGRFALRNAGRQAKPKPLLPAGIRADLKSNPRAPKHR